MDFFKKKDKDNNERKNLPELPGSSQGSMLPELPPLPSLPRTRAGDAMNLSAIKGSVSQEKVLRTSPRTMEITDDEMLPSLSSNQNSGISSLPRTQTLKEPVFVRIDKFKDALKKFQDVKYKVDEIEEALQKIRQIKNEEETELKSWENDVRAIKEKVNSVETSLFTKLE